MQNFPDIDLQEAIRWSGRLHETIGCEFWGGGEAELIAELKKYYKGDIESIRMERGQIHVLGWPSSKLPVCAQQWQDLGTDWDLLVTCAREPGGRTACIRRLLPDEWWTFSCDNGHQWKATDEEDEAAGHRCPICGDYWQ